MVKFASGRATGCEKT